MTSSPPPSVPVDLSTLEDLPPELRRALKAAKPLETHSLAKLGTLGRGEKQLVEGGILPEKGCLVIGAPYKTGKSWLVEQAAVELAAGKPFWGTYRVPDPLKVLLFDAENGPSLVYERLGRLADYYGGVNGNLRVVCQTGATLDKPPGQAKFMATVQEVGPQIIVLDPLYRFHTADENSEQQMQPVLAFLDIVAQLFDTALIVVHHANKAQYAGKPAPMNPDRLRGSTVIPGWATSILMLKGDPMDGVEVLPTLRRGPPENFKLTLNEELGVFLPKDGALDGALVSYVRDVGGSIPMPDAKKWVAEVRDITEKQAGRLIEGVVQRGALLHERLNGRTGLLRLREEPPT